MATVYLARDLRHRRQVAVKLLHPQLAHVVGAERFEREIEIAARLSHPHILPLIDSGTVTVDSSSGGPALPYYVMPYVPGESLRSRLNRERRLPLDEAVRLTREVADALHYAHRHGILHRDIKPENILLSEGHAVVADFGVARALDEAGADRLTATGVSPGTPQYMSPEQVQGERELDGRVDQYALGCMLHEMLTGVPPFAGGAVQAVLTRRLAGPPPPVSSAGIEVPAYIEAALQRALAVRPDDRFPTTAEFAKALGTLATPTEPLAPVRPARGPLRWLGAAAVLLAIVGLGLWRLARPGSAGSAPIASLAILPVSLPGSDSGTAYLSAGINESVADLLRRVPDLRVTAPSLVMQLQRRRPDATIEELGRELGVGAVLTWSLRPRPDSLEIQAELLAIPGGDLLWSARYQRAFRDVIVLQTEIASTIASSLRFRLTGQDSAALSRHATDDPVTYDLYLRGSQYLVRASPLSAALGKELADSTLYYANRVLERAPRHAGAHFLRAYYYILGGTRGWVRPFAAATDSAWAELNRAFALDSTLAEVWTVRGTLELYLSDNWPSVRRNLATGVRFDPDLAYARLYYGIYLGEIEGALDSAISHLRHAVRIEPAALHYNTLGDLYLRNRQYDSAVAALREAVALDRGLPGPWTRLILIYERLGRWPEALEARRQAPDTTRHGLFSTAFREAGEAGYRRVLEEDVRARIDSLETAMEGPKNEAADSFPPLREGRIALLHAQLGEWREAMDWILREHRRRPTRFRWFVAHPDLAGLRNDPRWLPMVRQEGLERLLPQ